VGSSNSRLSRLRNTAVIAEIPDGNVLTSRYWPRTDLLLSSPVPMGDDPRLGADKAGQGEPQEEGHASVRRPNRLRRPPLRSGARRPAALPEQRKAPQRLRPRAGLPSTSSSCCGSAWPSPSTGCARFWKAFAASGPCRPVRVFAPGGALCAGTASRRGLRFDWRFHCAAVWVVTRLCRRPQAPSGV